MVYNQIQSTIIIQLLVIKYKHKYIQWFTYKHMKVIENIVED